MKRILVCLAFLIGSSIAYSSEYFQTQDHYGTVLRVQNISAINKSCEGDLFDYAYWSYLGMDGKRYTLYYDKDIACHEDYNKFLQKVYDYDYKQCLQYGGGSACKNRK